MGGGGRYYIIRMNSKTKATLDAEGGMNYFPKFLLRIRVYRAKRKQEKRSILAAL